jgi:tetratricopeptide (TPR) repeat protein
VVDDSYINWNEDSLQNLFFKKSFNYDTIINDIQTVDTLLKATGELLFESGRFDFVIPENRFPKIENTSLMAGEMPWNEVRELCDTFKTDALLSLDYFKTRVITDYEKTVNFEVFSNNFRDEARAEMKVSYEALFRIYDPSVEKVIMRKFMRDTVIWNGVDRSARDLFYWFTPVKQALTEAGIAIALDLSGEISPTWLKDRRSYFANGDANLKSAAPLVNSGQWEQALALWMNTAETSNSKSIKSKAEFNIALAYEMLGDIDSAIDWAMKSYTTMYRINTYNYLETLEQRKKQTNKQ